MRRSSVTAVAEQETWGDGTPKVTIEYVVSWWERDDHGNPRQRIDPTHRSIDSARRAYQQLPVDTEPSAVERTWNPSTRKWQVVDLVGRSTTGEQRADARRAGVAMVRAVLAHKRGHDTRGATSLGDIIDLSTDGHTGRADNLNTRGHNHADGHETCPVCSRAILEDDPAECTVCDYLCDHGHTPVHPFGSLAKAPTDRRRPVSF